MARRAAYVDSLRSTGTALLLVDAGNFFAVESRATDIISVVAWKEMERLQYDAVTLGRRELENWSLVKQLLAERSLPLVTTNLELKRGEEWGPVGVSHLILGRAGLCVGILGLTAEADVPEWVIRSAEDSLRLLPAIPAAHRACEKLRGQVDLIVALLASDARPATPLTCDVPEIDVVVGEQEGCSISGAVITVAGSRGRSLGIVRLGISSLGELISYGGHSVALTDAIRADPVLAADARRVVSLSRRLREEIRERRRGGGRSRP